MIKDMTIVSLSSGILGESFSQHEVKLGLERLQKYGIQVHFSQHALSGLDFVSQHPELRAKDLLDAMKSDTDMILCAIGGDDTYRLLPYLFEHGELQKAVRPKIFLGFSDTTMNHFMLRKVGLNSFYGQAFLPDVCELDHDMLPYSKHYFEELITTGSIAEITPAPEWYETRTDFSPKAIGTRMTAHPNEGFVLLQGSPRFSGKILGGCIDTIYDMFDGTRYADSPALCRQYGLFPELSDWQGKILLLETSEEKPTPAHYREMLLALRQTGVFKVINGILVGKPDDETYAEEYRAILREVIDDETLPVVCNLNIGHASPRCIIPLGIPADVDIQAQVIRFAN